MGDGVSQAGPTWVGYGVSRDTLYSVHMVGWRGATGPMRVGYGVSQGPCGWVGVCHNTIHMGPVTHMTHVSGLWDVTEIM